MEFIKNSILIDKQLAELAANRPAIDLIKQRSSKVTRNVEKPKGIVHG